ncbi:GntR family transcriptional regulator [Pseudooceanicola aestuarii]|uniref:GntR family transcriptional regulator n=1 Tax=Pseudooceanicola aestuarii TaxID=2697319 RepID=UPI0013D3FF29|nr:GntR family transcriptional regulator [Pseudooceanicola aestuarii]
MRRTHDEMAMLIRERICIAQDECEMLLHEGELAQSFGVSRTPIRQVLQLLAYEGLVETRTGIGTVTTPLHEENRQRDGQVHQALLLAAAACACPVHIPEGARASLLTARDMLTDRPFSRDRLFSAESRLLEAADSLIPDTILSAAFRAASWRNLRWTMRQPEPALMQRATRMAAMLSRAADIARSDDSAEVLRFLSRPLG